MNQSRAVLPAEVHGQNTQGLDWLRLTGSPHFDYPIDYALAVLRAHEGGQRVEFLVTWEPDAYCHFHRHIGATASEVLAGELHVHESEAHLEVHKIRKTGHATANDGGDVHMERAGPAGTVVYYDMRSPDGRLFDILADDRRVLRTVTIEDFVNGALKRRCRLSSRPHLPVTPQHVTPANAGAHASFGDRVEEKRLS